MILVFPDFETLKLCLTSGIIPPEVSLSPVVAGMGEDCLPWIETNAKLPRTLPNQLRKLGVQQARSHPSASEVLDNWLQVLPVVRQAEPPLPGSQTPVLFELPDPSYLPVIVGEMLRLSNDRQSFCWLEEDGKPGPVLLRVVGPPYYTLLRALDQGAISGVSGIHAYVEQASNVWVEIGYTHPLVDRIQPPPGQQLLLRHPRRWMHIADEPFRDIYEILDFKLPQSRLDWDPAELKHRLRVPLRLIEGDAHDPELWVLREDAVDQLDALVRDSKESLIHRLSFAVGSNGRRNTIVLRVRPSKQPPPQLVLNAQAYCTYLKLPNLFLPVGTRLHPVLRRDAIRKLLAEDSGLITWLEPNAEKPGSFTPQVLPDDAFRPLQDWVDYVLDHDRHALEAWMQEFRFDFQPFVCVEDAAPERPRPPGGPRKRSGTSATEQADAPKPVTPVKEQPKAQTDFEVVEAELDEADPPKPSAVQLEIAALEKKFVEFEGALDDPERLKLWTELARRYAATKANADAALCWVNRLWEFFDDDIAARRDLVRNWLQNEKSQFEGSFASFADRVLQSESPAPGEIRAVVVGILAGALQEPPAPAIMQRLSKLQQFLERHERAIGVRIAWLGYYTLASLAHNDALGLARVRDRLLDRLAQDGLSPERDLPNFLRTAGHQDSERLRVLQARLLHLRELARAWLSRCKRFHAYEENFLQSSGHLVDLIFAFGLARIGENDAALNLLKSAETTVAALPASRQDSRTKSIDRYRDVHEFLFRAYRYRIEQAISGRPHMGALPVELRDYVDRSFAKGTSDRERPWYILERMREKSKIIEPQEGFHPYRLNRVATKLDVTLARLPEVRDGQIVKSEIVRLLTHGEEKKPTLDDCVAVLDVGLSLSARIGESFTIELVRKAEETLAKIHPATAKPETLERIQGLLRRAFFLAAHFGRADHVQQLTNAFVGFLKHAGNSNDRALQDIIGHVSRECLRGLRKMGMRDEVGKLLDSMEKAVLPPGGVAAVRGSMRPEEWGRLLRTLLHLASAWMYYGWIDRCQEIVTESRRVLKEFPIDAQKGLQVPTYIQLGCAYVGALALAPITWAMPRIEDMLENLQPCHDLSTMTDYCAWRHLELIETVVLAIINEDFALGPNVRRWLDEDEYLIRRRIHADHRRMKDVAGM